MAVGNRKDLRVVKSIPSATSPVREAGRHTRGIPLNRVCFDLLASILVDDWMNFQAVISAAIV